MNIIRITLTTIALLLLVAVGFMFVSYWYYAVEDSRFSSIELPKGHDFKKPSDYLNNAQIDSLQTIPTDSSRIEVIGDGYSGYDFYMWHKPIEKGVIYIKAFEVTTNERLTEEELANRTMNTITELSSKYHIYKGHTVIYEGTFEKYYPARFELWFKSAENGEEQKLTEKTYLIDGWDR